MKNPNINWNSIKKRDWLYQIEDLAYDGRFTEAKKLIATGTKKGWKITKKEATQILKKCGIDVKYSFVKPLVDIGGKFSSVSINYAKAVLKNKKSELYKIWKRMPDNLKGFELVLHLC